MSKLPSLTLTAQGAALLAKVQAGAPVSITKWEIGDGVLGPGDTERSRTSLIHPLHTLPIADLQPNGNRCMVTGQFKNTEADAFVWRETGLFANDPDAGTILYAYGNVGDEGVSISNGAYRLDEYVFGINLIFDTEAEITATIDRTMVFATLRHLDSYVHKAEKGAAFGVAALDERSRLLPHQIPDIDCGLWDSDSPIDAHNSSPYAHQTMLIDGNDDAGEDDSATLEEHMVNPNAHSNLVVDGNLV